MSVMNKKSNTSFLLKYHLYLKMFVLRGRWGGCPQRAGVESRGHWPSVGGRHRREVRLPTGVWQISAKRRGHPHCGVPCAEVGERVSICRDEPARESECKQGILPGEGAGSVMWVWYTPRHWSNKYVLTVMRARVLTLREWSCKHGEGEHGRTFRIGIRSYQCELMDCNVCISIWHQCWYINIGTNVYMCVCIHVPYLCPSRELWTQMATRGPILIVVF